MQRNALVALGLAFLIVSSTAQAQDSRQNAAGQFDFYVLSLSWSPSYCDATAERGASPQQQCGTRPYSFVVHGLWPQYQSGFPEFCQQPAPRLDRRIVSSMLDLMPAPRLIFQQWDKHGTCSGLNAAAYFELIRKARAGIKIPPEFIAPKETLTVSPEEVETAFIKANAGLSSEGIAVTCDSRRLSEVRLCLGKDLAFRTCPDIDARACRREKVVMPPMRPSGSSAALVQ